MNSQQSESAGETCLMYTPRRAVMQPCGADGAPCAPHKYRERISKYHELCLSNSDYGEEITAAEHIRNMQLVFDAALEEAAEEAAVAAVGR